MDEILEKLESAEITPDFNDDCKSNFEGLYKNWGKLSNQEDRRKQILETQKSNRNDKHDQNRGILELLRSVEEENQDNVWSNEIYYRPSIYVAGFNKISPLYNKVLMLSEWMIEKPEDFIEEWYVVPCPKGVRMLVVASRGITKCYTKFGHFRFEKRTALPGGNPCHPQYQNKCCVLDCFYYENTNTMFVLDIIAWNSQPMTDGETEFRHFWLQSQMAEIQELKKISKQNQILFSLLPKVSCKPESFNEFMAACPFFPENKPTLDGLLFYHKKAHYVSGQTPLVSWLYPFMVPEVLGSDYTVNEMYLINKPEDYTDATTYIENFEKRCEKKNRCRRKKNNKMDTSEEGKSEMELVSESQIEDTTKTEGDGEMDTDSSIAAKKQEETSPQT